MLPKVHAITKTFVEMRRSRERLIMFKEKNKDNTKVEEAIQLLDELLIKIGDIKDAN
jgi:hypothetical protein